MLDSRKGITPVIAIVLLLLITVGAVGVVYTQFQNLANQNPTQQLNRQQKIQNTKLTFSSAYKDTTDPSGEETINVSLRNVGSVGLNVSKQFILQVIPEGSSSPVGYDVFDKMMPPDEVKDAELTCFEVGAEPSNEVLLNPGETYTCDTGIVFPALGETIGLRVTFKGAEKYWDHTCAPSGTASITC